ncbi:MAG TPA: subclass B1 metallo-beta-lactamase [Candidatus Kapabacteria bacterium]|nr:subclass B1 metallo-beta-lactamase [Candidatus Kapabacteria bacterium]
MSSINIAIPKVNYLSVLILFTILILNNISLKCHDSIAHKVYKLENLIITQVSEHTFQHTSFLPTQDYGIVPSNGLIVSNNNEAIVFDTPVDDKSSQELIEWVTNVLHCKIIAVVPTHFHQDCLGGLNAFHANNIPSYAYYRTIEFAKESKVAIPQNSFQDSLILNLGNQYIIVKFFGEGHTKDNVVAYYPFEDIMFGGCLVKEIGAKQGYLNDANVNEWANTVEKLKNNYPNVKFILPGHGKFGDSSLLDYTIKLFRIK